MRTLLTLLTILFLSSVAAAQTVTPWPLAMVGVPGVGIGPINLGMTQAMVFNRLGTPHRVDRDDEDIYWIYRRPTGAYVVSWTVNEGDQEGRVGVDFIYTNIPGTSVGGAIVGVSTLKQVVGRYGWWDITWGRSNFQMMLHWNIGLRVTFRGENDIVFGAAVTPRR